MPAHTKPRPDSSALVPGISVFERTVNQYSRVWTLQAVAQEEGKQRIKRWSLAKHGMGPALREASRWRHERAPGAYASAQEMERACWGALSPALLSRMREAGVEVHRPKWINGGA